MNEPTDNLVWTEPPGGVPSRLPFTPFEEALLAVLREVAGQLSGIRIDLAALSARDRPPEAAVLPVGSPVEPAVSTDPGPTPPPLPRPKPRSRLAAALVESAESGRWATVSNELDAADAPQAVAEVLARPWSDLRGPSRGLSWRRCAAG
jgi:hypothetical protein